MLLELKRQIKMNWTNFPLLVGMSLGVPAVLAVAFCLVAYNLGDRDMGTFGSMLGLVMAAMIGLIFSFIYFGQYMNQYLKMGATRRQLTAAGYTVVLALTLLMLAGAHLLLYFDLWLLQLLHLENNFSILPSLPLAAAILAGVCIVGPWMGALWARYGLKGFYTAFALFMLLAVGAGPAIDAWFDAERTDAFARAVKAVGGLLERLPIPGLYLMAAVLLLALLGHTLYMMLGMQARD